MVQYSASSSRADGAINNVIMNGNSGFLGYSKLHLSFLEDGWIRLSGYNEESRKGWKLLSRFTLEPGTYTLTGMKGQTENTVALQLHIEDDTGFYRYLYQYDEDVQFTVERTAVATLHAIVFPKVENLDVKAQPAVYRDE